MIVGAHAILYSKNAEADRAFLKDILRFPNVDVGGGWLIFGLPPSEVAVHPADENDEHELYLMCDDVAAFTAEMGRRGIRCSEVQSMGWGLLTHLTLPGGGRLGVYQARHARPRSAAARVRRAAKRPARRPTRRRPAKTARKAARRRR